MSAICNGTKSSHLIVFLSLINLLRVLIFFLFQRKHWLKDFQRVGCFVHLKQNKPLLIHSEINWKFQAINVRDTEGTVKLSSQICFSGYKMWTMSLGNWDIATWPLMPSIIYPYRKKPHSMACFIKSKLTTDAAANLFSSSHKRSLSHIHQTSRYL